LIANGIQAAGFQAGYVRTAETVEKFHDAGNSGPWWLTDAAARGLHIWM
jgi:hypothetical protein